MFGLDGDITSKTAFCAGLNTPNCENLFDPKP